MSKAPSRSVWDHPWLPYLLIAGVALIVLVPGTWHLPLIDRDEPRFAEATREMIARHEWIIPYFNHHFRFDKPVLTYWLMRGGYLLFGIDPFGARFHSIISALLTAVVIFALGRRHFSNRIGGAAAVGFLTCFQVFLHGRSATADMPMVLAVAVSQMALYELLCRESQPRPHRWFFILYVALAIGFLAKGPIAILVPLLTVLLLRFALWRRPLPWARLKPQWGLPLVLIIVGAWGVPALYLTHGLFWQVGMEKHVIDRGLEVFDGRFYSPFFYLVTAFFSLCPWIAFAGEGFRAVRAHWDRSNAFLAAWLLSPYLIFTFYATQLPHYVMPGFPAFFLLTAQALEFPESGNRGWVNWWWRASLALPALLAGVFVLALAYALSVKAPSPIALVLLAGALLTMAAVVLALSVRSRRKWAFFCGLFLMAASAVSMGRGLHRLVPAVQLQPIFNEMPADTRYLAYRFTEGSLVFYSHGQWQMTNDVKDLKQFLKGGGPRLAVVLEREVKVERYLKWMVHRRLDPAAVLNANDFSRRIGALDTHAYRHQDFTGLNLGRFSWVTLRVYYRLADTGN